jgi:hypothetical protein
MGCKHETFGAEVAVARIADDGGEIRHFVAEVTVRCSACGLPFHFVGPPAGLSFSHPTVNVGATTLHAPIAPGVAELSARLRFEVPS